MEPKIKPENLEFAINKKALEKINAYARLACRESSRECYGFLLVPRDRKDGIIYDACLAKNQLVSSVHGEVEVSDVKDTKEEYNLGGYKAIGCWQSHGHGTVFHSPTDDRNLENIILEAANNCTVEEEREEAISLSKERIHLRKKKGDDVVVHLGRYNFSGQMGYEAREPSVRFVFKDSYTDIKIRNGFACLRARTDSKPSLEIVKADKKLWSIVYSLVVNTRGENYVEAGIVEWEDSRIKRISKKKNLKVKVVEIADLNFSLDSLTEEVEQRVKNYSLFGFLRFKK